MNLNTLRHFTYELPQTLLGYILTKIYSKELLEVKEYNSARVHIYNRYPGGISLGRYILVQDTSWFPEYQKRTIKHEYGHCVQSKYLGWLYLPVVGICSGLNALIYKWLILINPSFFAIIFVGYETKRRCLKRKKNIKKASSATLEKTLKAIKNIPCSQWFLAVRK